VVNLTIALLTDALGHRSLTDTLQWCAARGVEAVELGVGGYSPAPHADRAALLAGAAARRELQTHLGDAGIELVALNASGNPLHPDAAVAGEHERALREAVLLAAQLDVERVVAMSGCPGGPGGGASAWPVFAGGAWLPDMEGLWEFQWSERIAPFWERFSAWARSEAPTVTVCLELHPGTSIYNPASFSRLREVTAGNVGVNFDPSHFWWQGIDPVRALEQLGEHVRFVHGKDTVTYPERIALNGVLDFRWPDEPEVVPWHFCAVGRGRSASEWARLIAALRQAGYEGPISIEHEDPTLTPESGVEASLTGLRAASELIPAVTATAQIPGGAIR
jgi:sugar phosphate isomerase/epimerase